MDNPSGTYFNRLNIGQIVANSSPSLVWSITDQFGNPVDLTGKDVAIVVTSDAGSSLSQLWEYKSNVPPNGFTVSGSTVTLELTPSDTAVPGGYQYVLWNLTDLVPLATGTLSILTAIAP
jgi:hypothetical protein